jgi:uncharacterized protein
MRFHVAGLLQEPVGATRQFEAVEDLDRLDEDVATAEPVRVRAKLTRTNAGILVDAKMHSAVRLTCSRCLAELTFPLDVRFREEYQPTVDVGTGLPLPEPSDRATFTIDDDHVLDLTEGFRQYALLNLPMAPLCRAACAGLCPQCGKNLNDGPCDCPPVEADARWRALAEYLLIDQDLEPVGEARGADHDTGRSPEKRRRR